MINSFWIFLLRINDKNVSDGHYVLSFAEMVLTAIILGVVVGGGT